MYPNFDFNKISDILNSYMSEGNGESLEKFLSEYIENDDFIFDTDIDTNSNQEEIQNQSINLDENLVNYIVNDSNELLKSKEYIDSIKTNDIENIIERNKDNSISL
ncbi:hypothetical protein [Sutterella wadsworthensis]|uniref:hypothetical protein n=1 Tax=Sutterella wadsworthensis TaxID=40545 RepID=UPI0032BFD901